MDEFLRWLQLLWGIPPKTVRHAQQNCMQMNMGRSHVTRACRLRGRGLQMRLPRSRSLAGPTHHRFRYFSCGNLPCCCTVLSGCALPIRACTQCPYGGTVARLNWRVWKTCRPFRCAHGSGAPWHPLPFASQRAGTPVNVWLLGSRPHLSGLFGLRSPLRLHQGRPR